MGVDTPVPPVPWRPLYAAMLKPPETPVPVNVSQCLVYPGRRANVEVITAAAPPETPVPPSRNAKR